MTKANKARLHEILLEHNKKMYPTMPDHCRAIEIAVDTNEKGIKANLKAFCKAMGYKLAITDSAAKRSVRIENMTHPSGRTFQKMSTHFKKSEFEKGHHDIELSKNNILFCIEIKAMNKKTKYKDVQSDVQKSFEKKLNEEYGNDYYIIRGMDDFFELFDTIISPKVLHTI